MSAAGYTLTWQADPSPPISDASMLRPDAIGLLSPETLARVDVPIGRATRSLGELFNIDGSPGDTLTLRNLPPLPRIGAAMTGGTLVVDGDAGDDLGASMKAGLIHVRGSAGHRVGGPLPQRDRGMTGGTILVDGQAGDHVGYRMRRGLIAVRGQVGASPGYQMLAGSIVLLDATTLDHPGLEMRRGTIFIADRNAAVSPTSNFRSSGKLLASAAPVFMLLTHHLRNLGVELPPLQQEDRLGFWIGDRFELNKGEIVQWQS